MCFALFFTVCKYRSGEHISGYTRLDAHENGFVVPCSVSSREEGSTVRLARLLALHGSDSVMSFSALKQSAEIDRGHHTCNKTPFLGTVLRPKVFSTLLLLERKMSEGGQEVVVKRPGYEMVWLQTD